jgi:hypothetical protein
LNFDEGSERKAAMEGVNVGIRGLASAKFAGFAGFAYENEGMIHEIQDNNGAGGSSDRQNFGDFWVSGRMDYSPAFDKYHCRDIPVVFLLTVLRLRGFLVNPAHLLCSHFEKHESMFERSDAALRIYLRWVSV